MIDADGSCPVLNMSCWLPPAAPCQLRIPGRAPSEGGDVSNTPGGPVGTTGEDPAACHAARAAPWLNGRPNGPRAVPATAREKMLRLAVGAASGLPGWYGGRTKVRERPSSRSG